MKRRGSISVKIHMAFMFILLLLIMSVLFIGYMILVSQNVYHTTTKEDLKELIIEDLTHIRGMENGKLNVGEGFIYELSGMYIVVYNQKEALLSGQLPVSFTEKIPFEDNSIKDVEVNGTEYIVMDVYYPVDWDNNIWVRGIASLSGNNHIMKNYMRVCLIFLPIFLTIAGVLSYISSHIILKPLRQVIDAGANISGGNDLKARIGLKSGGREFVELSDTMDGMLDRLQLSFENEKQFTSDASHELRTPISVIKGAAEYSIKYDEDPKEFKESMGMVLRQANYMSDIIENLLNMVRMSQGRLNVSFEKIDLSEVLSQICNDFMLRNNEKKITLNHEIKKDIFVMGNKTLLARAFSNIIDNAFKYGKPNGNIWVSLKENERKATISIKDDGIGVENDKKERIFERFYRADESRGENEQSAGLGLSMVKEIVNYHGGDILFESIPNVGSEFIINLIIKE